MKLNNNDDSHNSGLNLLIYNMLLDIESHPAWVCGLKPRVKKNTLKMRHVTPCVGVWIETWNSFILAVTRESHPAWVCGLKLYTLPVLYGLQVTPCVGVWIETHLGLSKPYPYRVTPCVGVWIETNVPLVELARTLSHPALVCGLKHFGVRWTARRIVTPCVGECNETRSS